MKWLPCPRLALAAGMFGMFMAPPVLAAAAGVSAPAAELSLAARAARFPRVQSAQAEFTQERVVSLMDEVLRAKGRIVLRAPAVMRFTLAEPEPLTIAADGATVRVIDAKGATLPIPPELSGLAAFARTLTSLLLGGERPERFDERWEGPDAVTLTPSDPTAPFGAIRLRFPSASPLPDEIVLDERGGDRTTIRLSAVQIEGGGAPR